MHENLYKLKQEFLDAWPIEKLEQMTLEQYTNLDKTSFCYWVEAITTDLGSIWGGSAYKFGIFKRRELESENYNDKRKTDGEYAWYGKYGDKKEDVFETIKTTIIKIAKSSKTNNLEAIDKIDLGNALKWKIAFLYGDFNCLNAFKLDALRLIATNLGIEYSNKTPISQLQREIMATKPEDEEYFAWSHKLWKQYETGLIDVKSDFAQWLNKNTFDSYRAYLGYSNKGIEDRLDEINSFFEDVNFFQVDPTKINGLISTILFMMSKKERVKNPDFIEYDSKNSNGIPKAILGKNNYIKFLKEKFEYVAPNYWIFQGNPTIYNITSALNNDHLKSWKVAAHREKIKIGDKIIIWQTGDEAGCYALAEVTSDVDVFEEEGFEQQYYVNNKGGNKTERVKIKIEENLADHPILWKELKNNPNFSNFKAGNQGTNFSATEEEYNSLLKIIESRKNLNLEGEKEFREVIQSHDKQDVINFFEFLDSIVLNFNIQPDDTRVVTGTSNKQLNLTIGQRYCWNLYNSKSKRGKYGLITKLRTSKTSEAYEGKGEQPFYNYFDDYNFALENQNSAIDAIENELNRTKKSSFTEHNNLAYRKAIFDKEYRNHILNTSEYNLYTTSGMEERNQQFPLNQILYGPPGTGKTYELRKAYFPSYTLEESSVTKETFFEEMVRELTWWQVIALALIEGGTSRVNDLLKNRWVAAKANMSESKNVRATLWGNLQMHTVHESTTEAYTQRQVPLIFDKNEDKSWSLMESELQEQSPELYDILGSVNNFETNPQKEIKHYVFTTFHQSFSYEDFVEGIKPKLNTEAGNNELSYQIENGVFKDLCLRAQNDPTNRYAIFIDEINRGNVSAIFGELITLIEPDKRLGADNEIKVRLPYSKTDFGVPSNVDIYGTMNTADRSVEALDTALRRRFSFKEIMPNPSLLENIEFNGFNLKEVLQTINERVEFLLDRDHTIGHSYFMNVKSGDTKALEDIFKNKVIPLLQEYFYHDYEKIALILGAGFVEVKTNHAIKFPSFDGIVEPDNVTLCKLIDVIDNIEDAITILLNRNAN